METFDESKKKKKKKSTQPALEQSSQFPVAVCAARNVHDSAHACALGLGIRAANPI
jgi:hypothetical protein